MKAWKKRNTETIEENIAGAILAALAVSTTLFVSPALGATAFFLGAGAAGVLIRKSKFNHEARRLEKKGYIALTKSKDGWFLKILKKGSERNKANQLQKLSLPIPKVWDGKWRLFIFDIPEKFRSTRNQLRQKLKSLGLYNIQRSVFVYPHDCRKELNFVGNYYGIGKYASYGELSYSDIDKELRQFFKSNKLI